MTDRRAALGELARGFAGLVSLRSEAPDPGWIRPPGARAERTFKMLCDGCGACVEACPHAAIGVLPAAAKGAAGTPAMAPELRACHLCEDTPCITACDRGALVSGGDPFFLGLAVLQPERCFATMGPECGSCVASCPRGAIRESMRGPVFDDEACVGCGLCREACPVFGAAIRIV